MSTHPKPKSLPAISFDYYEMHDYLISNQLILFIITLSYFSCVDLQTSKDPSIQRFIKLTDKCNKMKIIYGDTGINSSKIVDTIITNPTEITLLKKYIQESVKSDTCYELTGTISFVNKKGNQFSIDFGLSNNCHSFYYFIEGKPVPFKMTYQSGMYLSELMH